MFTTTVVPRTGENFGESDREATSHKYRHRPDKTKGLQAPAVRANIPNAVRRIMKAGWKEHIPLYLLTDAYCQSREAAARHDSSIQIKGGKLYASSSGTISSNRNETILDLREWSQAMKRLIYLIREYFDDDYAESWKAHFNHIFNHPDRDREWPAMIRYCIELRTRAQECSIDPETWQHAIYDRILHELRYPATSSMAIQPPPTFSQHSHNQPANPSPHSAPPSYRSAAKSSSQTTGPSKEKHNEKPGNCFRCGTPGHKPRSCSAKTQANGKKILIHLAPDGRNWLIDGAGFCYSFNTTHGCTFSVCKNPPHICSLCLSSTHGAQHCPG